VDEAVPAKEVARTERAANKSGSHATSTYTTKGITM